MASTELEPRIWRAWAMPNAETFSIEPINLLLKRWLTGARVIVDPFARNSKFGTHRNDFNVDTLAESHMPADEFVKSLRGSVLADAVLFDPPYSPTQMLRAYQGRENGQNAHLYKEVKDGLDELLRFDGIAISCGWNSGGFGKTRGYQVEEILLVNHGAAHNDTIITVERKLCR